MSIAEMKIVGVIGPKNLLNRALRQIILQGSMHIIDALSRVNSADFFLPPTERNIEALEEEAFLKPYSEKRDFAEEEKIVNLLHTLFDIKPYLSKEFLIEDYDYDQFMKQFLGIYNDLYSTMQRIEAKLEEINGKKESINNLKYISRFNLEIDRLNNMEYLIFKLIRITRENYDKVKKNYENIPAVILKVLAEGKYITLLYIAPITLEETLEKIFSSLNYTNLPLPREMKGTVDDVLKELENSIEQDKRLIESLKKSIEDYKEKYIDELKKLYSRLEMEKKIEELKSKIAIGNKSFFIFGFVPASYVAKLKEDLEKKFSDKLIIIIDEIKKPYSTLTPPTKLNNIGLFKPFESLIKMYGIPSYQEKDPTIFFALTYLLIFGAMFGDVGQGLILLIGGLILEYIFQKIDFGTILNRLGLSSIIFGVLYGSVFGSEEIIPALLIRPMANINNMLITAVAFGVIFIFFSYIFGIINAKKESNLKEGLLGENGLAGLLFYLLLLYTIFRVFVLHQEFLPLITISLLSLLVIILFKEPLASRLFYKGTESSRKLSANDYIEEGFGLIEMLLSMLSNTISFLRVGAFALNHVGLYIAFLTLANMMRSAWGNWAVLVIGNIVILTLEALIVFIQALRLEYYELFTKYYRGDGIEYAPAKIDTLLPQKDKKRLTYNLKSIMSSVIDEKKSYIFINQNMGV